MNRISKYLIASAFLLSLFACDRKVTPEPKITGGGCSYETVIDTFTIDSLVNDSIPFYVLSHRKYGKACRNIDLPTIYLKRDKDTVLFTSPEIYLNRKIIIHEQHILTGACNPYGLTDIEIMP